jgi:hypothetical protein
MKPLSLFDIIILIYLFGLIESSKSSLSTQILTRLTYLLEFLESDPDRINVDGLVGIRMAEGTIVKLQNTNFHNEKISIAIKKLQHRITILTEKVSVLARIKTPEYYDEFEPICTKAFVINRDYSKTHFHANQSVHDAEKMQNYIGDDCFVMLINSTDRCRTDYDCLEFVSFENESGYTLTHQLYYFLMADQVY